MPSGRPLLIIMIRPAPMIASERTIAGTFHRVKSTDRTFAATRQPMLNGAAGVRRSQRVTSKIVLETKTAVKTFASRPIVSVVAKPRIGIVPKWSRTAAAGHTRPGP